MVLIVEKVGVNCFWSSKIILERNFSLNNFSFHEFCDDQKHSIQQQPKPSRQPTTVVESDIQTKPHGENFSIRSMYTLTVPIQPQ